VQFDKAVRTKPADLGRPGISDALQLFAKNTVVDAPDREHFIEVKCALMHCATHHIRRKTRTLFIGEKPDGQRPPRGNTGIVEAGNDFETGQHAQRAIVASAGSHAIDVRTGHHRRHILEAVTNSNHIADAIDTDPHTQLPHPGTHLVASQSIFVG